MKKIIRLIFVLLFVWLGGCKLSNENIPVDYKLTADSVRTIAINDLQVKMKWDGQIFEGNWNDGTKQIGVIFLSGLWIGMEQDGVSRGNIISSKNTKRCNYTSRWKDQQLGVFGLDAFSNLNISNWPIDYGAPVTGSGRPEIFGDAMLWASLTSDTTVTSYTFLNKPIKGLRVTQAVYAYQSNNLRNVIFIRYTITNLTSKVWNNVYTGFYSDTDLNGGMNNLTGCDTTRSLSYTYDKMSSNVTGFALLETPGNKGATSHRIMRKNNYIDLDFSEYTFTTPQQILYALKGLSNSGAPMVNPVTGQITKFAFTGDPVRQVGWLDTPIDVRSLISTGPYTLNAVETTTVTVAWVATNGINLADAITNMKDKIDYVRQNSSLWKF